MDKQNQKRIALYIRVSSDEQKKEGLSVEAQLKRLRDWASNNNYYVYKVYIDAGVTAKIPIEKRPDGSNMLKDAEEGLFTAIAITKFDRAFRDVADAIKTLDLLHSNKLDIVSLTENIDTTTPMGRAMYQIISVFAELERNMTSSRVKDINQYRFEQGLIIGKAPIGYKFSKQQKKYIIDDKRADMVRDIFSSTLDKIRWKDICDKYKISPQTYYNILKNKTYIGIISLEDKQSKVRKEKKGNHEAIITEEIYNKANKII